MKKFFLTLVMAATVSAAFSQFNMHITYGTLDTKRVTFGYDICKVTPYVALDAFNIGLDATNAPLQVGMIPLNTFTAHAAVIAPTIGVRYYMISNDKLKGFLNVSAQKAFISGNIEIEGMDKIKASDLLDSKDLWQFQAGFGAEYFFNHNLSLVAEYGYRYFMSDFKTSDNPILGSLGDISMEANPGGTYARLGLGFHF